MKMGEGWDGGFFAAKIAPIPAFPRSRGKERVVNTNMSRI
jgi:hypothetical protein